MIGNTIGEFIDDLLLMGGPENKALIQSHSFSGKDYTECVNKFEDARIFDGLTIYEAEQEIEVLFG